MSYTVAVEPMSGDPNPSWFTTITTTNNTWPTDYNWSYTYTTKVYMYQIFCPRPRCKGKMWGEIDSTVTCPKCNSTIKVVMGPQPDYEVEVT